MRSRRTATAVACLMVMLSGLLPAPVAAAGPAGGNDRGTVTAPSTTRPAPRVVTTFATDEVDGLALGGAELFWHTGCGTETQSARSRVRAKPTAGGTVRTLYFPAACQADRVASDEVAVDASFVYWLTRDGRLVRLARGASAGTAPTTLARTVTRTLSFCCSLAVDDTTVAFNDGLRLYTVPKGGGSPSFLLSHSGPGATSIRNVRIAIDDSVFYLVGRTLRQAWRDGSSTRSRDVASNVSAYALHGARVFWAAESPSSIDLRSARITTLGDARLHRTIGRAGGYPTLYRLAVDATNLYWHEQRNVTGGPIRRLPIAGGTPVDLTSYRIIGSPLLSNGSSLFWHQGTAIYQVATGSPPATPTGDVWLTGMEITQATQQADNAIPLVGGKMTAVRVYARSREDDRGAWTGVTARLCITGGRCYSPHARYAITVSPAGSSRERSDDSFLFLLDQADTRAGDRTFTARLHAPSRPQTDLANDAITRTFRFGPARTLTINGMLWARRMVGTDPAIPVAPWGNFELHRQFTENVFPVSTFSILPLDGIGRASAGTFDTSDAAEDWAQRMLARMPAGAKINRLDGVDGCACGYWRIGTGFTTQQDNRVAENAPGSTMAQELAHNFGLNWHTFDDPQTMNPSPYPYRDESIGPNPGMKTAPLAIPPHPAGVAVVPTRDGTGRTVDYMSYIGSRPNWTSDYTYCTMLSALSGGTVTCPRTSTPTTSGGSDSAAGGPTAAAVRPGVVEARYLFVSGRLSPTGAVTLLPFEVIERAIDQTRVPPGNAYTLVLRDGSGKFLASYPFGIRQTHHDEKESRYFRLVVPFPATARQVEVEHLEEVVAERAASPAPPVVAITSPGGTLSGPQTISWASEDPNEQPLRHAVEYSANGGASWIPLRVGLAGSSAVIDFDLVRGSANGLLRVIASDGFLSTTSDPIAVTVPEKAPQVSIASPGNGASFLRNQPFIASATAFDWEDGAITAHAAFSWHSDVDGALGTGRWRRLILSPGVHTLSVKAVDGDGRSASAAVRVTVLDKLWPAAASPAVGAPQADFAVPGTAGAASVPVRAAWSGGKGVSRFQVQIRSGDGTTWGAWSFVTRGGSDPFVVLQRPAGRSFQLRVRGQDTVGNWGLWRAGGTESLSVLQETSGAITYTPGWTHEKADAMGGSLHYAKVKGARATAVIEGHDVAWVAARGPDRGRASVYLDGVLVRTVDLFASGPQPRQVVFARSWSAFGKHTVEIVVEGTADRPRVDVDAFAVIT